MSTLPIEVPFGAPALDIVRTTHRQKFYIYATHPSWGMLPLDVERCQISWDEARSPRVDARLTCKVPEIQEILDRLDPRQGVRIQVFAGYDYGATSDMPLMANLVLMNRTINRPENSMELDAQSDEALVISAKAPARIALATSTTTRNAISNLITQARGFQPNFTSTIPTSTPSEQVVVEQGGDYWDVIKDLTDRVDAEIFDDGRQVWVLRPRPRLAGQPSADLRVGANGVVLKSTTGLSRTGEWANSVMVKYEWKTAAGADRLIWGSSNATGPYSPATVGRTTYTEDRPNIAISQAQANSVAKAILARRLAYGRTFSVRAISHFWLRPGMTVNVKLPTGPEEKHLVKSVLFDLTEGWMDVETRLPDNVNTPGD